MTNAFEIDGIDKMFARKLLEVGVATRLSLLERGATPDGRKVLAAQTGISDRLILAWVIRADLARVKGITEPLAELLAAAGVDTVIELAQRRPEGLYERLVVTNLARRLVRVVPTASHVADWVEQARKLPRVVIY
jgi:hypothetical protein